MIIGVEYTTRVLCWVDTETKEIREANTVDEPMIPNGAFFDENSAPYTGEGRAQAADIAVSEEWPSWR